MEQAMPKETINGLAGGYDVRVGWSPEPTGHVQVGVETTDGYSLTSMIYGDQATLLRIGREATARGWQPGPVDGAEDATSRLIRVGRDVLDLIEGSGPAD